MGAIYSLFWERNDACNDDADPDTGLTSRDKVLIKNSWEIVMKDPTGNGIKLFMSLFEIQPRYHSLFPFKDVPIEKLKTNKKFHAHCTTVIYSIGSVVNALDDAELLRNVAAKIGENHAKRKVDEQALEDVKIALVNVLNFLNKDQLEAWVKLWKFFVASAVDAIKNASASI